MNVKLLTEHHLEFLSLKGGCIGLSESTIVKVPHCWKSHVTAQLSFTEYILIETRDTELLHVFARYTPSLALIRIPVDYSTTLSGILIQDKTTGFTVFLLACTENGKIMRGSRVLPEGVQHWHRYFRRYDPNTTISGPSSARQRNAIKWRFSGGPMIALHGMLA